MPPRCNSVGGLIPDDSCTEPLDLETKPLEHGLQNEVMLETITSPPTRDHLVHNRCKVKLHRNPQQRVEILKWNVLRMQSVNRLKRCKGWRSISDILNSFQVGIKIGPLATIR